MFLRAASSVSTTSASSTGALRFPPADIWSRRTARHGWLCSARTCWNSRSSSAAHDPTYEDMLTKFAEHFFYIASGHEPARSGRHVGRGGRFLLRRSAASRWQRHAAQGSLHGGTLALVRHHSHREVATGARSAGDGCDNGTLAPDTRTVARPFTPRDRVISGSAERGILLWSTRSGSAGSLRRCSTRMSS